MKTPVIINCETTFDTANGTMTQQFSERVKIVLSWHNLVVCTFVDEKIVNKTSFEKDYSLLEFMKYQLQVADSAEKLEGL